MRQPEIVVPQFAATREPLPPGASRHAADISAGAMALGADSLFDHNEDVEFILDPITLRRGRATMTRQMARTEGKRAVISF